MTRRPEWKFTQAVFDLLTALVLGMALAAALGTQAKAQDSVTVLLGSHHFGAPVAFEEVNPGVLLTWQGDPVDLTVGAYRNSYGKLSVSAALSLDLIEWDEGSLAVFGGVALYPGDGRYFAVHAGDLVPMGGLSIRHGFATVQVMPGDGVNADAVVAFGVTFDLG